MERCAYFDNCKAILIILVVVAHLLVYVPSYPILYLLWILINSFHMPAFVFISGCFAKKIDYKRNVPKYLVIYVIATLVYSLTTTNDITYDIIHPIYLLWYILCLTGWYTLMVLFSRVSRLWALSISIILGVVVGYFDTSYILAIPKLLYFFPFFLLGYYTDSHTFLQLKQKVRLHRLLPVALVAALLFLELGLPRVTIGAQTDYATLGFPQWYGGIINLGLYALNSVTVLCFFSLVPQSRFRWTIVGQYTLWIYLIHGFLIRYFLA